MLCSHRQRSSVRRSSHPARLTPIISPIISPIIPPIIPPIISPISPMDVHSSYGDPLEHPQTENYFGNVNCNGERSCYDEGKRAAECLTMDYHREHGLEVRIVRIFNTYGPRMALDDGRVVSNFVAQAILGQDLTVFGDGQQTRSFQYISDLVRGMVAMMDQDDDVGPVNIGNPNEFTMLELAEMVKSIVNPDVSIVFVENTADDPTRRKPDITRAKTLLGWEPKVMLSDGLLPMLDDFRQRLDQAEALERRRTMDGFAS
mmetsp:Transcript_11580/g.32501  ORF Transcript_11580/g.32501 Transcript_11580/m.32501 type:complete len:260 (-) Transcript_11580:2339-3118(-)